jgi:RNA polymerase sigma factor (sigma-70 family)
VPRENSTSGYSLFTGFEAKNAMDLSDKARSENGLTETAVERLRLKLRYKVLYHLGHGCADVDDLVQESLARFFRAEQRGLIRNPEEFGAFLNGVCRNVILEYRRRMRREPPIDPDVPIADAGSRPEAEVFEMRDAIDNGLQELAERDRAILRSLYLEGREKEEICKEWGMSDAQFRVVLFRAKERFRRVYNSELKRNSVVDH